MYNCWGGSVRNCDCSHPPNMLSIMVVLGANIFHLGTQDNHYCISQLCRLCIHLGRYPSPESFMETKLVVQSFSTELWFLQIPISNWPCYLRQMIIPCEMQPGSKAIKQARLHGRISYTYMQQAATVSGRAFTGKPSWFHRVCLVSCSTSSLARILAWLVLACFH
jgi:hypothetical protein